MGNEASKDTRETVAYVEALQNAVRTAAKNKNRLKADVKEAHDKLLAGPGRKSRLGLGVSSDGSGDKGVASLRVTCPSRSVVSAEIPQSLTPDAGNSC
jgi:hypothetical protein